MSDSQAQYLPVQLDSISHTDLDESEKVNSYACNICNQTYTRVDHLSRHYRSRRWHWQIPLSSFITDFHEILERSRSLARNAERASVERKLRAEP